MRKFPSSRFWSLINKWHRARKLMLFIYILLFCFFILCAFSASDSFPLFLGFIISFPFLLLFLLSYLSEKRVKKVIASLSEEEAIAISSELDDETTIVKEGLFFTKNYIVGIIGNYFMTSLDIIKYSDIIWVYDFPVYTYIRRSGKKESFLVIAYTKDYKKHILAHSFFKQKVLWVSDFILSRNSDVLSGYTPQNIEFMSRKKEQDQFRQGDRVK